MLNRFIGLPGPRLFLGSAMNQRLVFEGRQGIVNDRIWGKALIAPDRQAAW